MGYSAGALLLKDRSLAVIAFTALENEKGFSILRELVKPMFKGVALHRPALFPELSEEHTIGESGWQELESVFYLHRLPSRRADVGWRMIKLGDVRNDNLGAWDDNVSLPLSRAEGTYLYQFSDRFADRVLLDIHERYGSQKFVHLKDEMGDVLEWLGRLDQDMLTRTTPRPLLS
jgi:hypothetical protein